MNGVICSRNERILPCNNVNISVGKKIKLLSTETFNKKKFNFSPNKYF